MNGVSVTGWGVTLKALGRDVVLLLVLLAGFGAVTLSIRDVGARLDVAMADRLHEHQAITSAQDNLACVLLIPPEERIRFSGDPRKVCDYLQLVRGGRR